MENLIFRMGFTKNQYIGRLFKKGRGLGQFADLRGRGGGAWQERGERGVSNDFRGELKLL